MITWYELTWAGLGERVQIFISKVKPEVDIKVLEIMGEKDFVEIRFQKRLTSEVEFMNALKKATQCI